MTYQENARACFQSIAENTPANNCSLLIHENGALVDAGCACPGGWGVAKSVLEALTGGRGQVGFAQRQMEGAQFPAVELFLDDPEGAAAAFAGADDGIFGIRAGEEYALGVCLDGLEPARRARGNLVAATAASLLYEILQAAALIPRAVEALRAAGVRDLQWAWSSCPVAPLVQDAALGMERRRAMSAEHGVVNVWVRGEEEAIRAAVNSFPFARLRVHELASASTFLGDR